MNKWYRSSLVKGVLIVFEHLALVMAVISMVWVVGYPGLAEDIISGKEASRYQDSEGFATQVFYDSEDIIRGAAYREKYETDGKYDGKKIVDIKEYQDNAAISNENKSGLAYSLDDLVKWSEKFTNGQTEYSSGSEGNSSSSIVVCKKSDGTFDYYYYYEFKALLDSGELSFVTENAEISSAEILNDLRQGNVYEGDSNFSAIKDSENKVKYIDGWNFDGYWLAEEFAPVGAKNLLEVVNNNPMWNGKLSEVYESIRIVLSSIYGEYMSYRNSDEHWKEGDTNLTYLYADIDNKKVYTNRKGYENFAELNKNIEAVKNLGSYVVVKPKLADYDSNMRGIDASMWQHTVRDVGTSRDNFVYLAGVDTRYPVQDEYYSQNQLYNKYAPKIKGVVIMGTLAAILFLAGLVWLTCVAGRHREDEELHLHFFDRWKTELSAAGVMASGGMALAMLWQLAGSRTYRQGDRSYYSSGLNITEDAASLLMCILSALIVCAVFLIGYLSLVRRIKAKSLWKNSLLRWLLNFITHVFHNVHMIWRTVVIFLGFILLHWFVALSGPYNGFSVFLMIAAEIVAGIYLVRQAVGRGSIRTGIERIANGEVDYKIPLSGLKGDQLLIAERVNAIGQGLDAAVEASMKNERLKTDLITNVSHDIKTPLTSIINYVDLLKRENFTDPKVLGYLDVLEAKALRLKTLTEDVVEASKVSTGNITLEYMNINLVEMIQQTSGEFEEKFKKRSLSEVLSLPDGEAVIRVDGRRMWRVLENIYNNAAKYAMEGTRIYADLITTGNQVIFSLKNISEQPLNINADELTERFIRGDLSRSTEGSGLGLSIAKSLTQMQGGQFDLYLDGDLFRVTITFPRMVKISD